MTKKKVDLAICDIYGVFSDRKREGLTYLEEKEIREHYNKKLRKSYGYLRNGKGESSNVLVGVRPLTLTSVTDDTIENDVNKAATFKKQIFWRKDRDTEGLETLGGLHLTSDLFMWGVTNSGWTFNRYDGETFFDGVVQTHLTRKLQLGEEVIVGEDRQDFEFLENMVYRFSKEGDIIWDMEGNIKQLKEVCDKLKREYVCGELSTEDFGYDDLEFGRDLEEYQLQPQEEVKETTVPKNEIVNMDCFAWLDLVEDKSVDLLLTDPPYNVSIEGTKEVFGNGRVGMNFGDWDFGFDTVGWIDKVSNKIKEGGTVLIFNSFRNMEMMSEVLALKGYSVVTLGYWLKSNPVPHLANRVPVNGTESILIAYRGKLEDLEVNIEGSIIEQEKVYLNDGRVVIEPVYVRSHFEDSKNRFHTTQKPESIFRELVLTFSNEGDLVMDSFGGSGVTAVACRDLGRDFITTELDETYFKKSTERLKNEKSRKKIL